MQRQMQHSLREMHKRAEERSERLDKASQQLREALRVLVGGANSAVPQAPSAPKGQAGGANSQLKTQPPLVSVSTSDDPSAAMLSGARQRVAGATAVRACEELLTLISELQREAILRAGGRQVTAASEEQLREAAIDFGEGGDFMRGMMGAHGPVHGPALPPGMQGPSLPPAKKEEDVVMVQGPQGPPQDPAAAGGSPASAKREEARSVEKISPDSSGREDEDGRGSAAVNSVHGLEMLLNFTG